MPAAGRVVTAREVLKGLHPVDLRNLARSREVTTKFQAAAYIHRVRSRCPQEVRISSDGQWSPPDQAAIEGVYGFLAGQRLIQVDVQVCAGPPVYHVRLYVPLIHADLGYMAGRAMLPAPTDWVQRPQAEITAIVLPEWSEQRAVLVDVARSVTYILGSDYYGDIHNSVLRIVAGIARRRGHLALHAGSAQLVARSRRTGELRRCGVLFAGVGGAGKTTLAAWQYELDAGAGESASIRQDDRVILHPSGFVQGTEGRGLYVRTLGLGPQDRPSLHGACAHEDAVLENVWVNGDGSVDFGNDVLTTNGRAIVPIRRIAGADGQVDLARCTHVFFLVRDEQLPAAGQVVADKAVKMLRDGECGDVDQLLSFLKAYTDVECHFLNAARAGADEAAGIVRGICRQELRS